MGASEGSFSKQTVVISAATRCPIFILPHSPARKHCAYSERIYVTRRIRRLSILATASSIAFGPSVALTVASGFK